MKNMISKSLKSGSIQWVLILLVFSATQSYAQESVSLASLFQDNMVLQQKSDVAIWGWAEPGENIKVIGSWQKESVSTISDANGKWMTQITTPKAGGPYKLTVKGSNTISLENVMIGEVWVCGGQSNMAMTFYREKKIGNDTIIYKIDNHEKERLAANYSDIRVFRGHNSQRTSNEKMDKIRGRWQECSPEMAQRMAAVPYFFGRELHQKLNVPVGLIVNAISATQIEPWISSEGIASVPQVEEYLSKIPEPLKLEPTFLFNTNVYPFIPYTIRGAIWYQGESNRGDHMIYYHKMRAMINSWRSAWGQGDFPFYYVQLAPCNGFYKDDLELPKMWEAQAAAVTITNTGMAPTTDISDLDLHPANKQDVGKRLSLWALAKEYGQKGVVCYGPRYKSMRIKGNKIHIKFDNPGGELMSRDGKPLDYFSIAGEDGSFVPALAEIDGDKVFVYSNEVTKPIAVRFGFENSARPNLMNAEGLPAYPFRTDNWLLDGDRVENSIKNKDFLINLYSNNYKILNE
jgi:sialate O-acetylesterase